jgi:dolichol-phosphate mannosyltransferase
MSITVVIPALNEEGNVGKLVDEIFAVVPDSALVQVIVVDDGSTDGTAAELEALVRRHKKFRTLRHARRAGQSCAIRTGILAASTPIIATLDGDGQNDPRDIMHLAARLGATMAEGPALAGGMRVKRKARRSRRFGSVVANAMRNLIFGDNYPDAGCGLKLFWREAYLRLPFFTGLHRFQPTLFRIYGYGITYAPVNDRPRQAGRSKYTSLGSAFAGIYDMLGVLWLKCRTKVPVITADSRTVTRVGVTELRRGDGGGRPPPKE